MESFGYSPLAGPGSREVSFDLFGETWSGTVVGINLRARKVLVSMSGYHDWPTNAIPGVEVMISELNPRCACGDPLSMCHPEA